ncbi:hypothetical protein O0L34_g7390 [Tuta absoluta]|nr:hypothetical protein O0L34_g7390 [Tuta absoluta]
MATGLSFGILSVFDHKSQDWDSYKSRLLMWFIANDINDATDKPKVKRRAILLSALSEETHKLASNLVLPKKLEDVEYDEILNILSGHFTPKRVGFSEKHRFYSAYQQPGEAHTQWAARIRGLAAHCGFKNLEEALVDRFLMGMVAGPERDKLYSQDLEELTLAKALDMAESVRCARQAAAAGAPPARFSDGAGAVSVFPPQEVFSIAKSEKCKICGYANHKSDRCRFKGYRCKKCGLKGHLRKMCDKKEIHFIEGSVDEGDDGKQLFNVYNIKCDKGKPMIARVSINGQLLEFEIDSGSDVCVLSEADYARSLHNVPLSPTAKRLSGYTGSNFETVGVLQVEATYGSKSRLIDLYVVRNGGPPLLGRDFISAFQWEIATTVNYVKESDSQSINSLINKFPNLFSGKLGCFNKYKIKLNLKPDSKPIFFKPRPVAFALKEKIDTELDRLLHLGILKPVEFSEYASPIVPALKKDGSIRLCVDYSVTINKQLEVVKYPLPTVEEMFTKLHNGQQFSKLDLSMAYNQLVLSDESQLFTCINTHRGLFKYTRLVFGLASAPALFQRAIESVLAGLEGVIVFLDDILVTGKDKQQHLDRLSAVLKRLDDAGLTVQRSKCEFMKSEVSYLGHVIDRSGIRKSPDKVKAILEAPRPTNVSQLQSFLGLTNYYRNFVPDASSILSPFYDLLHKNSKWEWTSTHEQAFNKIKNILSSDQVLVHYNADATIVLTVDAAESGLGAILSQVGSDGCERPISFASRTLTSAEKKYSQIQKEATAIIFGVRRFHQYLYGRADPFVLRSDHKPLISIFGPQNGIPVISANRLQRYAMFLSAYNYVIEYVRSSNNSADFLSRAPLPAPPLGACETACSGELPECEERAAYVNFVVEGTLPVTMQSLRLATEQDDVINKIKHFVYNGWPRKVNDLNLKPYFNCRLELAWENGVLMRGHKVVLPLRLRDRLCQELHSSHFGIVKMKAEARKRFWFPGIDAALERLAAACAVCAQLRPTPPHAPLAVWNYPPHAFHRIHLDFLGPYNNQMYLVIVDAYSKWVECYHMSSSYGSKAVINCLCDFMSRFGIPKVLVSDNGTSFTSNELDHFCQLNGIRHLFSPAFHPSSNGQAESFVKIIKKGLKSIILDSKCKTPVKEKIAKFLFDYRNSKNSTTGKSPAELVFGRSLRSRLDLASSNESPSPAEIPHKVERNQCSQVKQYGGVVRKEFKINDNVWVKKTLNNNRYSWIEGIIKKKVGKVIYVVYLPHTKNEVTKHVDQLLHRSLNTQDGASTLARYSDSSSWIPDLVPDLTPETTTSNIRQEVSMSDSEDVLVNQEERETEQMIENLEDSVSSPVSNSSEKSPSHTQPPEIATGYEEHVVSHSSGHSSEADAINEEPESSIQPERVLRERYNLDFRRFF